MAALTGKRLRALVQFTPCGMSGRPRSVPRRPRQMIACPGLDLRGGDGLHLRRNDARECSGEQPCAWGRADQAAALDDLGAKLRSLQAHSSWVDPRPGDQDLTVPPAGLMAGIYARTDVPRGVHKAPANELIRSIRASSWPSRDASRTS